MSPRREFYRIARHRSQTQQRSAADAKQLEEDNVSRMYCLISNLRPFAPDRRSLLRWTCGLAVALCTSAAMAQEAQWPVYPLDGHLFPEGEYGRGPGGYLSIFSIIVYWLLFLVWIKAVDWVNRDTVHMRMSAPLWNSIVFFPFLFGFFMFGLSIPYIGFFLTLATLVGPFVGYVLIRNKRADPDDRVFTPDHLRHVFSGKARKVGVKVDSEKKFDYQKGAPVEFEAMGAADDQANQANLIKSRQSPGFLVAKEVAAETLSQGADRVMLDYTQQAVAVKYQIDGVWHDGQPRDRESGDAMLAVLKTIANLNAAERRARQEGHFGAVFEGKKYAGTIASQGTQTGERVVVDFKGSSTSIESLEAAGMRPKMLEAWKASIAEPHGISLISAMPSGGMSTTLQLTLEAVDRYMRDYYIVEDPANSEPEVENVTQVPFDGAAGQTPVDVFPALYHKDPDAIVVPNLADGNTVASLCEQAIEDSRILGTIRAKEAAEALLRVLMLKVPQNKFAPVIKSVLNVRLIRKLCQECRQPYAPNPEMLKKLGIPPERVQALYQPPPPPEDPKQICQACRGVGYAGRTGIFELLTVDDKMREALIKQPKLDVLRKVARANRHQGLQEEGLVLVVKGITSMQELQRILKQ